MAIRVYIVDDHPLIIDGLVMNFQRFDDVVIVGSQTDPHEALRELTTLKGSVDVVLLDISMPHMSGFELCSAIKDAFPALKVIFLTFVISEDKASWVRDANADGMFHKSESVDELVESIREVAYGEINDLAFDPAQAMGNGAATSLTRTELIVLYYIAVKGCTSREIAEILSRSEETVYKHRKNVMEKLGIRNVQGLVWYAMAIGLHLRPPVDVDVQEE